MNHNVLKHTIIAYSLVSMVFLMTVCLCEKRKSLIKYILVAMVMIRLSRMMHVLLSPRGICYVHILFGLCCEWGVIRGAYTWPITLVFSYNVPLEISQISTVLETLHLVIYLYRINISGKTSFPAEGFVIIY